MREHFVTHWRPAVWEPLLALFGQLQRQGELRQDVTAEQLVRQFLGVNIAFLLSRLLLAPDLPWGDEAEIAAIARVFASGAHAP